METRELLAGSQRSRFAEIPRMDERELARHHTLPETDLTTIAVRARLRGRVRDDVEPRGGRAVIVLLGSRRAEGYLPVTPGE